MKTLTKPQALSRVDQIDGWLTLREAELLYDLATKAQGPIVEIGSWQGRSTSALALGSMAGNKQPLFAIDPHKGVPPLDRETEHGANPGWKSSSPEILRANLDSAGVNGLVTIVPKTSIDAASEIEAIDLLFVDGDHVYESVLQDLQTYLPKVSPGGIVVIHDCDEGDLGVVRAVNEVIAADPLNWCQQGRVDTALVCKRKVIEPRTVFLAVPGNSFTWGQERGIANATLGAHKVCVNNSGNGWDDMNLLWTGALNWFQQGRITHFAMLHADVEPTPGWLDILLSELDAFDADLISCVVPIKDNRGLTTTGIGEPGDPWQPLRRLTMREVMKLPPTFGIEDTPHPDKVLLHNTGCWVCDLRNPAFRTVDEQGRLKCVFNFPIETRLDSKGNWVHFRESEDWHFSRAMHELPIRSFATTKVELKHVGSYRFPNSSAWGTYLEGDEDTAGRWRKKETDDASEPDPACVESA